MIRKHHNSQHVYLDYTTRDKKISFTNPRITQTLGNHLYYTPSRNSTSYTTTTPARLHAHQKAVPIVHASGQHTVKHNDTRHFIQGTEHFLMRLATNQTCFKPALPYLHNQVGVVLHYFKQKGQGATASKRTLTSTPIPVSTIFGTKHRCMS